MYSGYLLKDNVPCVYTEHQDANGKRPYKRGVTAQASQAYQRAIFIAQSVGIKSKSNVNKTKELNAKAN
jgi:hypothetical protein